MLMLDAGTAALSWMYLETSIRLCGRVDIRKQAPFDVEWEN